MGLTDFFSSTSSPPSAASSAASSPSSSSLPSPPAKEALTKPVETASKFVTAQNPQGIKPCCACPETKIPRDDCFLKYGHSDEDGEEGWRCKDLVEAHRRCMKNLGFNI